MSNTIRIVAERGGRDCFAQPTVGVLHGNPKTYPLQHRKIIKRVSERDYVSC